MPHSFVCKTADPMAMGVLVQGVSELGVFRTVFGTW